MKELYVIFRHDTQQYYYGLTPRGEPVWIDKEDQAQALLEEEADNIKGFLNRSPYKNGILDIQLA
jgi:hypothetical protein